jgi:hypothetical protein
MTKFRIVEVSNKKFPALQKSTPPSPEFINSHEKSNDAMTCKCSHSSRLLSSRRNRTSIHWFPIPNNFSFNIYICWLMLSWHTYFIIIIVLFYTSKKTANINEKYNPFQQRLETWVVLCSVIWNGRQLRRNVIISLRCMYFTTLNEVKLSSFYDYIKVL